MKSCNKTYMKHALVIAIGSAFAFAAHASEKVNHNPRILAQVQSLYGLDEEGAIQRLAAEAEASNIYRRINRLTIEGYAGAWFDGDTQRLQVALSDPASESVVVRLGAVPVSATWSLRELEAVQDRIQTESIAALGGEDPFAIHIDVIANRVVVATVAGNVGRLQQVLASYGEVVEVREAPIEALVIHPTANMRGADGARNQTFEIEDPSKDYYCSVGFTTENGYYTAGHCGRRAYTKYGVSYPANTIVLTDGTTLLGTVGDSTMPFKPIPIFNEDTAWVQTVSGHNLQSKINAYSGGTYNVGVFDVPAAWSGLGVIYVGQTVCRYGYGSQMESCGTVDLVNSTMNAGGVGYLHYIVQVSGGCSDDGDSGGPWISASDNLALGTNIGANPTNTCPTPATYTYFQPISYHIAAYGSSAGNVLTAHGPVAPDASGWLCPDPSISSSGWFLCRFDHYESQGDTSFYWKIGSVVNPETSESLFDACISGKPTMVKLILTNPYGTTTKTSNFVCP